MDGIYNYTKTKQVLHGPGWRKELTFIQFSSSLEENMGAPISLSCWIFSFSNSEFGREWGVQGESLSFWHKLQKQRGGAEPATVNNVLQSWLLESILGGPDVGLQSQAGCGAARPAGGVRALSPHGLAEQGAGMGSGIWASQRAAMSGALWGPTAPVEGDSPAQARAPAAGRLRQRALPTGHPGRGGCGVPVGAGGLRRAPLRALGLRFRLLGTHGGVR